MTAVGIDNRHVQAWTPTLAALADAAQGVERVILVLHLPKTGGTTLGAALARSRRWRWASLPPLAGAPVTDLAPRDLGLHRSRAAAGALAIHLPHVTIVAAGWLAGRLAADGVPVETTLVMVRPVRERLASLFADYWTQVAIAEEVEAGCREPAPGTAHVLARYLQDSRHYRRRGRIDGRSWFRAFGIHGGGMPFFLSDVFPSGPSALSEAVESGAITVRPSSGLDTLISDLTGEPAPMRRRVSEVKDRPDVEQALLSAHREVARLAERDDPYDTLLAALLDDPGFAGGERSS